MTSAPSAPLIGRVDELELLALEALGDRDVEALVQAELGRPPGPALAEAVGRAGGNPLRVVELLRSPSSEGVIHAFSSTEGRSCEALRSTRRVR